MVVSADDASNMIAEAMGNGSIEKCVEDVNRYLLSIGCKNTHFTNPHGLHHPNHVSTAEDLALLCQEAMKEPLFREMVKKARFERPLTNKQEAVLLRPTNRMLVKGAHYYAPTIGIKTGYHRRAGYCLAAQADKEGRSLIAVVLQAKTGAERFQDTKKLFEAAFQEKEVSRILLAAGLKSFSRKIPGGNQILNTYTQEPMTLSYYPSEEPKTRGQVTWGDIKPPIKKGTSVGEVVLYVGDKPVQKVKLYAANPVKMTFFHTIKKKMHIIMLIGITALIGVFITFYLFQRRTKP